MACHNRMGRILGLVVFAGSFAFTMVLLAEDTVEYINAEGKKQIARGRIESEDAGEVTVKGTSGERKIPVWQIESIRYDKQPPELATIRSKFGQGRYDELIDELTELGKSIGERQDGLPATVAYLLLLAKTEQAIADPTKKDTALSTADKFLNSFKLTRHYYPALEQKARILMAAGDYEGAEKLFDEWTRVDWPGYKEKGLLYKGICAMQRNQPAEADKLFEQVASSKAPGKLANEQRMSASVFKAESLLKAGKAKEAEAMLRKSLEELPADAQLLLARGHNSLGDALRAEKRPKEALYDGYMRTVVLHNKTADQLARALLGASQCCTEIGFTDDATRLAERLKTEFPNSQWAKQLTK